MKKQLNKRVKMILKQWIVFAVILIVIFENLFIPFSAVRAQDTTPSVTSTDVVPTPTSPAGGPTTEIPTPMTLFDGPLSTPSATPPPAGGPTFTPSVTPTPTPAATQTVIPVVTPAPAPTIAPDLSVTTTKSSGSIMERVVASTLQRHSFRSIEPVSFTVSNLVDPSYQNVHVALTDAKGTDVPVTVSQTATDDNTEVFTILPPDDVVPGKYTATVTQNDVVVSQQSFTWGVLAVNTDKSMYTAGDIAHLSFAVLDEEGDMICDNSNLVAVITDPSGTKTILRTADHTITVNSECDEHRYVEKPDYEATYQTSGAGKYTMTISAIVRGTSYAVDDSFEVQDTVPFDIQRESATRIYPRSPYPVRFTVKANQDFSGTITEYVPDTFTVIPLNEEHNYDTLSIVPYDPEGAGASPSGQISLRMPFNGSYPITLGFGQQLYDSMEKSVYQQFGLSGHDGTDFGLPSGTPVVAVDAGTVIAAGPGVYGTTVILQHAWGRSYYGHFSEVSVTVGQQVASGEQLGLSGSTGLATGPHLHFGMRLNVYDAANGYFGKINPMEYLGKTTTTTPTFVQELGWNVTMKKGDTIRLGYRYKAPEVSPELYALGPIRMTILPVIEKPASPAGGSATPSAQISSDESATPSAQILLDESASDSAKLASDSANLASQSAVIEPPAPIPQVVFAETRRWQVASDKVVLQSLKGMTAEPVNADTKPADFLVEDPSDGGLKAFVVDNTSSTKTVTYKSLRGNQQQVYKDNDVTELNDNNKLMSVGVITPQYWDTGTNTWVAYPRAGETKGDFKKTSSDKKRVKFDNSIKDNLGLGANFTRDIKTVTSGDTPSMKEDWTLTGTQKKRIMWEIQLKEFVLTQSRENVTTTTDDGTVRSINQATYGNVEISAPYSGNISWNEDAATNTVRIYFEPDGVDGNLFIDPTMSATSDSTTVTVTASGAYKIRFNATTGMADQLYLPDTDTTNRFSSVSSADVGWCIRDYSTFDTFTTYTSSSITLSESSSTRIVVTGVWTGSTQNVTTKFYLYPDRITVTEPINTTSTVNSMQYKPLDFTMTASANQYKEFDHDTLQGSWTTIAGSWAWSTLSTDSITVEAGVVRKASAGTDPQYYVGYWTYTPRETDVTYKQLNYTSPAYTFAFGAQSITFTSGTTKTNYYQVMFQNGTTLESTFQNEAQDYWHPYYNMITGTTVTSDSGDANADGYNEGQGYYSTSATDNQIEVEFSDTRGASTAYTYYDPVIKISNWTWSGTAIVQKSTDDGSTWTTLVNGTDYNITTEDDEAQVGTSVRYFQYLGTVSGSGSSTTHFRIWWQPPPENLMRHGKALINGTYIPFTF